MKKWMIMTAAVFAIAAVFGSGFHAMADTAENTQSVSEDVDNIQKENTQAEETPAESVESAGQEILDGTGAEGVSCYLDMLKNERLLKIYDEMDKLLAEKEAIIQKMYEEGEITKVQASQTGTAIADVRARKQICANSIQYDKFFLKEKSLKYKRIEMPADKSLGTIEECTARHPDMDKFFIAGCVTECENARASIQAQKSMEEYLEEVYRNTELLEKAGEASRLDVIESGLSRLEAGLQLEALYYEMNAAYYGVECQ